MDDPSCYILGSWILSALLLVNPNPGEVLDSQP
jgi:hypothetical protein